MSSLKFSTTMDTKAFEKALEKSLETVSEWAKHVAKTSEGADSGLQNTAKNLKQAIIEQKQYIKEVEAEIKKLEAAREGTTGSQRSNINKELGELRSTRNAEAAILQDMQRKSAEANAGEEKSQTSLIGSLGKWALGLASVSAAMKIGKEIIESTEGTAHKFEQVATAAASATQYFFKSIASGDWTNFWAGIERATRGAFEYIDALEKLENKKNEQTIKSSKLDIEIGKMRAESYSTDPKVVKESLTKLIELQKEKLTGEAKIAEESYKIKLKKAADDNNWNEQELQNTIEYYSHNKEIIEKGEEYNKAKAVKLQMPVSNGMYGMTSLGNVEEYNKAQEVLKHLGEEGEKAGQLATNFSKVPLKLRAELAGMYAAANTATAAIDINNRRDKQRLVNIQKQEEADAKAAAKKAKEDAELDNRIKATQELMKNASGVELGNLALKLVALEKEKKVRDDLINQARMLASDDASALLPLDLNMGAMSMRSGGAVTSKLANKIDSKEAKNDLIDTTKKSITANIKEAKELTQEQADAEKEIKERKIQTLNALMDITYEMGKQLGLSEDSMKIMDETFSAISAAAKGDYLGAAMSAVMAISDTFVKIFEGDSAKKRAESIERVNDLLREQNRLVAEAARKGDEEKKRAKELQLLKEKQAQLAQNEQEVADKLNQKIGAEALTIGFGIIGVIARAKMKKKLREELSATQEELDKISEEIKQAEQALEDMKVGGITENTLADSIAKGFAEGKTSVADFAEYLNQVLFDAVNNVFKDQILSDMQPLMAKVRESLSDKKLTRDEKEAISAEAKRVADENQGLWKDLTSSLDMGKTAQTVAAGLGGQIQRSMTEATGSELAGLYRRNADDTRIIRDYTKLAINNLVGIEANTLNTVTELKNAVVELKAINSNTKQPYTGKI